MTIAVALSSSGVKTAKRIAVALGIPLHARHRLADRKIENHAQHLRARFRAGDAIVCVGAAGALVRMLAPVLQDKTVDPPVVSVADDGSAVVPVLGGHHGANDLAREIGRVLGIRPAITTASDTVLGVPLDQPPAGWHLASGARYKEIVGRLLAGEPATVDPSLSWLDSSRITRAADSPLTIRTSHRAAPDQPDGLLYRPEVLAVGVGCVRDTDPEELVGLVRDTIGNAGLAPASVALVASLDLKMDEPAVHAVAADLARPSRFFTSGRLEQETPRLASPSDVVFREVGTHGVAEAAALASAGPDATLVAPKRRSKNATCAIALSPGIIDPDSVGIPRGKLAVVGTGPGAPDWRTYETDRLIEAASDLVGYSLYLDLLGDMAGEKSCHPFPLGAERERVSAALDLAADGRSVALVSSGDPGIYAMASLVFEMVDTAGRADWRRVEIMVAPGITALLACAARIGAPLGHDFCVVSLSDLLTPKETILRRLKAAAAGDFVVALYNPASQRRRDLLHEALEILGAERPAGTPVVHGRSLGRTDETVEVVALGDLAPETVGMLSLLLIGSSQTRRYGHRVYTPRGYRTVEHPEQ